MALPPYWSGGTTPRGIPFPRYRLPVSDQPWDGPAVLLVGVDGSDTSMRAGAYAAGMARRQHARLICLYVRPFSAMAGIGAGVAISMNEAYDEVAEELREALRRRPPGWASTPSSSSGPGTRSPRSSGWPMRSGPTR